MHSNKRSHKIIFSLPYSPVYANGELLNGLFHRSHCRSHLQFPRHANAPICHHLSVNDRDRLALYHPYRQVRLPFRPWSGVEHNLAVIPFFIKLSEGYIYGAGVIACGVRSSYPQLQFIFHILPVRNLSSLCSLTQCQYTIRSSLLRFLGPSCIPWYSSFYVVVSKLRVGWSWPWIPMPGGIRAKVWLRAIIGSSLALRKACFGVYICPFLDVRSLTEMILFMSQVPDRWISSAFYYASH